ncbi:transferrin receptor-like dimerization domain-containing protein [Stakelama sediminis]|uniref:N-acetylated-alpha-linked acidic dipeptidase n=1 Tax=Stakelama sediminis TaxID=463200 RepID=A0A840YZI6_9SPHN|nr:transferrin receptor-like dimerization domain-containing protein [Stakelama sediminis]MBB5718914.1 N-acetylated-alpha-linked acidic dipeptidase [Stakelama sediminis]
MIRRLTLAAALSCTMLSGMATGAPRSVATDPNPLDARFDRAIDNAGQIAWLKQMSSQPNQVGSPHDAANTQFIAAQFRKWGWDVRIDTYQVLYPTPISTKVEMVTPEHIRLGGQEPPVKGDPTSYHTKGALPPYLAYQGDGDVTGDLVYVNYGMRDDYEALARRGISVKGKIVIARYGEGWRGLKPLLAQKHGAIGCIIYSDPADDGYARGDVYPKGGWRSAAGVQRGSVQDQSIHPGDPLTPGYAATADAKRLTRKTAPSILKIPALPMSYGDATKLLQAMQGRNVPDGWQGALPFAYHIGGTGAVKVHLAVKSDWSLKPVRDVVATIPGSQYPDQWVVRGNHYDGWVFGASDPLTGTVAMLGEAKAIGALVKQGWRPKRSIVYIAWDGEEPGLLGSTEWTEDHEKELRQKALLYVNTDNGGRGYLHAGGSQDFQHLVNEAAAGVSDPETGVSVLDRLRDGVLTRKFAGGHVSPDMLKAAKGGGDLPIEPLGSGSDYAGFLEHVGIPSLSLGFSGESPNYGAYHSVYDSFHHVMAFDDPGLKYGSALSQVVGRIVLRMADAPTPPQHFTDFADAVSLYMGQIETLEAKQRAKDDEQVKLTRDGAFRAVSNPDNPVAAPAVEPRTPHLVLAPLENAVDHLKASASAYDAAYAANGAELSADRRAKLNELLLSIDQLLLDPKGLTGRPWFRNLIYAPGRFTGYGAKTIAGVREAIEERRFDDANEYAVRTARALNAYAARLDAARAVLDGSAS